MALKPGQNDVTVTYKDDNTLEYIYYRIHLEIIEADIQGNYELSSIVRDTVTRMITIENPLNKDVIFNEENIKFDEEINLEIKPIPFKIKKDAERNFEIKYRPLCVGEKTARLTLENKDLGTLAYDLKLIGIPSTTEKIMKF